MTIVGWPDKTFARNTLKSGGGRFQPSASYPCKIDIVLLSSEFVTGPSFVFQSSRVVV